MRKRLVWFTALGVLACQPAPSGGLPPATSPPTGASPSAAATPAPQVSVVLASPQVSAVPVASPVVARELVLGAVYAEDGSRVQNATLTVESSEPSLNGTIATAGGSFSLRDVPVGTRLKLVASAPGFSTRVREHVVRAFGPQDEDSPNRIEFGGTEAGMLYYLHRRLEIGETEPAQGAKEVSATPLRVQLRLTGALDRDEQGRFDDLVRLRAGPSGAEPMTMGTRWGLLRPELNWNDAGDTVVLQLPVPVVARQQGAAAAVELDSTARLDQFPLDQQGRRLGFVRAPETADGGGSVLRQRVAPFVRAVMPSALPSPRSSPDVLWGLSHATSLVFEIARDLTPLQVEAVEPLGSSGSSADVFLVRFNKPVYGFPVSALAPATKAASQFRYVVGDTNDRDSRRAFEAADAGKDGAIPGGGVEFKPETPNVLLVLTSPGVFRGNNRFKFSVGAQVEDIYGVPVGGDGLRFEGRL